MKSDTDVSLFVEHILKISNHLQKNINVKKKKE